MTKTRSRNTVKSNVHLPCLSEVGKIAGILGGTVNRITIYVYICESKTEWRWKRSINRHNDVIGNVIYFQCMPRSSLIIITKISVGTRVIRTYLKYTQKFSKYDWINHKSSFEIIEDLKFLRKNLTADFNFKATIWRGTTRRKELPVVKNL